MDHKNVVLKKDVQASLADRKLYAVGLAVRGLIEFITTSFEEHGIDKLHEMTDPSLDELTQVLQELSVEAKALAVRNENLEQAIHLAQTMVSDIKQKNPDLCANGARILKSVNV
ncbi:hypothetical protein MNZ22_15980 [Aeromonas encheleia]|uniref:hypothetical protein n=1 Tax=Aeromonas encheleia TaxID=73010 RepID=UPI001F59918C|nr:hypothetical protein [Aeromonas encheleia]UNP88135.1 hypothetical protein MNZ22_15980 [Aeromonas encheleia]